MIILVATPKDLSVQSIFQERSGLKSYARILQNVVVLHLAEKRSFVFDLWKHSWGSST